jgi:hypothetical protein
MPGSSSGIVAHLLMVSALIAAGVHTAASQATPSKSFTPAPVSVLTQRYDNKRTGANLQEHILTVAAVSTPQFQKLYTIPVTGQVYAQPLLVPRISWTDGTIKNVLIVATAQNIVHAFQVDDAIYGPAFPPTLLWQVTLGAPVPANFMAMANSTCNHVLALCAPNFDPPSTIPALPPIPSTADSIINGNLGLYNINPVVGILSTPVIDPISKTIFVVAKVSVAGSIENHLVAIDLVSGSIRGTVVIGAGTQVPASSSDSRNGMLAFDQMHHMQRPALLLQNGQLYIGFGSHQDTLPWHGWVFSYDPATLRQTAVWCSTPNGMGGAIWQSGNGIAGGDDGNIYVMTGNGEKDPYPNGPDNSTNPGMHNFANMFVQLSPSLTPLGFLVPSDVAKREDKDLDVSSSGPVLIPGTNILIGGEKEANLFVLDTGTHLGVRQIFQAGQQLDDVSVGGSGFHHIHGAPVLWRGSSIGLNAYFWAERDYLRAFHWDDGNAVFSCGANQGGCQIVNTTKPDQQSTFKSPDCLGCMPGGILSISADGDARGTGILWASVPYNTDGSPGNAAVGGGLNNVVRGVLHAFNAENIAPDLWNSESNSSRDGSFLFAKFNTPVVANGRVYMATFSNAVNVYGLRQWAKFLRYGTAPPASVGAGANFSVQATFLNAGITAWRRGTFQLAPVPDTAIWRAARIDLPNDVNPGDEVTIALNLTAPTQVSSSQMQAGACGQASSKVVCRFQWQMLQENVAAFGEATDAQSIQVVGLNLPPPPLCPGNEKCCETNSQGKCTLCLPQNQSCP